MTETTRKLSYRERARSLPHKRAYLVAMFWASLFHLNLIAILTATAGYFLSNTKTNSIILIALIFSAILIWGIGFLFRKKATCPLCKGTPFLDSRASKHVKAIRLFPFNYGTTNILRAILTRRFRCHFCGIPYDMLKTNLTSKEIREQE